MAAATPFLAIARGLIGFLVLDISSLAAMKDGDEVTLYDNNICDDGGEPFTDDGLYRAECTHEGCGMNDEVCYFGDYFERCLDVTGQPTGQCTANTIKCKGVIGCFSLWIDCGGQYSCNAPQFVGCTDGACTGG